MSSILLINDHPAHTGIGKYWLEMYRHLPNHLPNEWQYSGLMQNMGEKYSPPEPDITVQYRPAWCKQVSFGKWYNINSYFYYPRKIPDNHSLYHISSQMMGQSVKHVTPAIVTCHDLIAYENVDNLIRLKKWIQRKHLKALTSAAGLIFISHYSRKIFLRYFDYPEEKTVVIHHAASDLFHPRDQKNCRQELDIPMDKKVLIYVGSESTRKNFKVTLQVLKRLRQKYPDIILLRVGAQSKASREFLASEGLTDAVIYRSNLDEETLAKHYNAADLLIFPSLYEGFGMPVLEAMKSGLPIVASHATSIPEIVGEAGLLHNPHDVDAFYSSAERILSDDNLSRQMSQKSIMQAADFTWDNVAQQTVQFYRTILDA